MLKIIKEKKAYVKKLKNWYYIKKKGNDSFVCSTTNSQLKCW